MVLAAASIPLYIADTMIRTIVHLALHLAAPGAVARIAWREQWRRAWLVMVATMLVDVDHLLANPVFNPHRCSIGFHPLHTWPAIAAYAIAAWIPSTRWLGVGLLLHMALDWVDCVWMRC